MNRKILCSLFEFTPKTLYNWKKEERPIIELIEKYLSEDEIEEFIETKKIDRLENIEHYIQYEEKLMGEVQNILWSLQGEDASDLLDLVKIIQKEYHSKKKRFLEFEDEHDDLIVYQPYLYEYVYDFDDILEEIHDEYGNDVGEFKMNIIDIKAYILKCIFYQDIFNSKKISPRSQYYIQKAMLELHGNGLLSILIQNMKEFSKEVKRHNKELEREHYEKINMIDDEQDSSWEREIGRDTYINNKYPNGVPLDIDEETLEEEIDNYLNKKDEYKTRWKLLESNFPHLSKDEIRKIINDEMR